MEHDRQVDQWVGGRGTSIEETNMLRLRGPTEKDEVRESLSASNLNNYIIG